MIANVSCDSILRRLSSRSAWVFSVHATPVDITMAWNGHDQVDTAAIQPAVDADDSMQLQAMAIAELLSTAVLNDIDELIGNDDAVNLFQDTSSIDVGSVDQGRSAASIVHEVDLLSSNTNYYYYLVLIPSGIFRLHHTQRLADVAKGTRTGSPRIPAG